MIPASQFEAASAIKASIFLLGGLFGYVVLILAADWPFWHYSWLYYIYPIGMFFCVLPSIMLLDREKPFAPSQDGRRMDLEMEERSFWDSLVEAYITPAYYSR